MRRSGCGIGNGGLRLMNEVQKDSLVIALSLIEAQNLYNNFSK